MQIKQMLNQAELESCFEIFKDLRPHLKNNNEFIEMVLCQMNEGYLIMAGIIDNNVVGCIGYRIMHTLAWGKILYIDDLISSNKFRNNGCGKQLLGHAIQQAKKLNCNQVHLDTGYSRHDAHRLYLKNGFQLNCHHLSLVL